MPGHGNGCTGYYAVSLAAVTPSAYITWFQAAAACRNSGKRLATNQEWQAAAFGTPDLGTDNGLTDCNVDSVFMPTDTGSRTSCESDMGAFDLVGNVQEWVADWGDQATNCTVWSPTFGDDVSCMGGDGSVNLPGALLRGGYWLDGPAAGVFAVLRLLRSIELGRRLRLSLRALTHEGMNRVNTTLKLGRRDSFYARHWQ